SPMPSPSDFANANIDDVVRGLTQDEAISLLSGVGFWHTASVPRLHVPAIKVSDGPNGVRGNKFFDGTPAKAIPSATALGSTFDPDLIRSVASKLLANEAKLRAASIVLGPTVNIQRSHIIQSFESFSEDPYLSGTIAAAYVGGLQSEGVGACIKHFVGNDQEDDRQGVSSEVSPRALREIYLMPFMLAEKSAQPWAYMTAYNKINGLHVSENPFILDQVLRKEWKSQATVMSDWFGVYSVADSVNAGLDLEMPGVNKWRSPYHMSWSVHSRKITLETIKARARKVLELVQKSAKGAPEILDGDGEERTDDKEEDKVLMRSLAAQSVVLLKNEGKVLPLSRDSLKSVAIIGGNAKADIISGGGSASLNPSFVVTPFDGITKALSEQTE
ncbi:2925_t:CDS:2, partial [Acaulospora colombiana]